MNIPFVIVGNKCYLKDKRVVTKNKGEQKATKYRVYFFEISLNHEKNISETFETIVQKV